MEPTESMIEAVGGAFFLAHPLSNMTMVDACWNLYRDEAEAALTAAMPLIEAAVAERIADKIEDEKCLDDRWIAHMYYVEGREDSATIARTYPEWSKE